MLPENTRNLWLSSVLREKKRNISQNWVKITKVAWPDQDISYGNIDNVKLSISLTHYPATKIKFCQEFRDL